MPNWKKVIVSGSQAEFAGATGSFTGSFTGNGSGLTNLTATATFPTTLLTPLTSATQIFANDGVNKYVTAGQITGSAYAGVSGDITISAAGVASIAADSVALGTDTTGNYVATIDPGAGLTGGATTGEGVAHTLAVGAGDFSFDFVVYIDLINSFHFLRRVCLLVNSEDSLVEHVLKIRPHSIQRNVVLVVSFDDCLEVI